MNKAEKIVLLLISLLLITLSSCTKRESSSTSEMGIKSIMVSTSLIADVVSNIGGEKISIETLIKSGQSPHNYEPSPRDIARLSSASLVFVNGFDLEEGLLDLVYSNTKAEVIEVSQGVEPIALIEDHDDEDYDDEDEHSEDEDEHGEFDPHTWTSPLSVMKWSEVIVKALEKIDPENSGYYQRQYTSYVQKLQDLDSYVRDALASLGNNPVMITDHRFLEYFARDYGVKIPVTISEGLSSSSEPSPQDMARLIDFIRTNRIKALFIGNTSDNSTRKMAEAIRGELNFQLKIVTLLSGSLTRENQEGASYISYMKYNVTRIVEALK